MIYNNFHLMETAVEMDKQRIRLRNRGPEESTSYAGKGTSEAEVIEEQIFKEYVESFGKEKGQMEVRGRYDELKEMRKTSLVFYEGVLWHTGCRRDKELEIEQNNDEEIKEQRFQKKSKSAASLPKISEELISLTRQVTLILDYK